MKTSALIVTAAALLAACGKAPPAANDAAPVAINGTEEVMPSEGPATEAEANATTAGNVAAVDAEDDYRGRWIGVEGMYMTVADKPGGGVTINMQWDLDHKGKFEGSVTAEGLRFVRGGEAETAVHSDGAATGLKYLAGKKDCLTVKAGEGYCRD